MRVPPVVVAGTAGPGAALIASRPLAGTRLADADAASVTDEQLADLWTQVTALHAARVAHGRLNANHVVIDGGAVGIDGFELATGAAATGRRAADVAELLVSTALIVGDDRAVAAAARGWVTTTSSRHCPISNRRRSAGSCAPTASTGRSGRRRSPRCATPPPRRPVPTSLRSRSSTG